jgi:two-component system chemotaxis sensor kinase CheA
MNDNVMEVFRAEAAELLSDLESALLGLETAPNDKTVVGTVFRCLHTIKGSSAMVGCNEIASFAHELENTFELVRREIVPVGRRLIDLTLSSVDLIRAMLDGAGSPAIERKAEEIVLALGALNSPSASGEGAVESALPAGAVCVDDQRNNSYSSETGPGDQIAGGRTLPDIPTEKAPRVESGTSYGSDSDVEKRLSTYRIFFRPNPEIFSRGGSPALLLSELRGLGECNVTACIDDIPDLDGMDPELCYTSWDVILTTSADINSVRDVFIFVEDDSQVKIDVVDEQGPDDQPRRRLGEVLVERGDLTPEQVAEVLGKQKRIGELLIEEGLVSPGKVQAALMEQQHIDKIRVRHGEPPAASVRVPAAKLDSLVDLVGELVTVQASLGQLASSSKIPELRSIAEHVERLTSELRDNTMNMRALPIGTTFSKFKRLVRDLCGELNKEIELVTEGAETELDKTVIERLNDPLVHLIRNCVDHGIETPDARLAAGKTVQGTVRLSAVHSGAHVLIQIVDDGAGLDTDAIRAKAVEKGLIAADAELSEKEIFSLIFSPGFSTARQVTSVSGRGVGMDVVKSSVEALRGSIEISSRKGIGTTITLKLPLTLAIIDGLLVKVGDGHFVLPLSIVEECVELTRDDIARSHGRRLTIVRKEIVPYIRLRERFQINGNSPDVEQIVVTGSNGSRVGFAVDKVIGEHQTVIKNMGKMYRNVQTISGATILGDGTVALIVDVPKLVEGVELQEFARA